MTRYREGVWAVALLTGILVAGVASGCGDELVNPAPTRDRAAADGGATADTDGINTTGVGAGTGAVTGLPCDVQQLLENRCIACHLASTPYPLLTYENLLAPAPSDPSSSLAKKALDRMRDAARPMPPSPADPPTSAELDTFQAWVSGGLLKGASCTAPDGGAPPTGGVFNTPSVCTSNTRWTNGNEGDRDMHPGGACITCHSRKGPSYVVAGTVYPSAHEPNDCNGSPGPLTVVVTDANGVVTNIPVNSVGNFYLKTSTLPRVKAPFHVKVTDGTKERVMAGPLTAGDCNSCHTEQGVNGAPGRVVAP